MKCLSLERKVFQGLNMIKQWNTARTFSWMARFISKSSSSKSGPKRLGKLQGGAIGKTPCWSLPTALRLMPKLWNFCLIAKALFVLLHGGWSVPNARCNQIRCRQSFANIPLTCLAAPPNVHPEHSTGGRCLSQLRSKSCKRMRKQIDVWLDGLSSNWILLGF